MSLKYAAAVIIRDQKVLLIRRSLKDDSESGKWCPVNESLKDNELPEVAVIRGAKEEVGLNFTISKQLSNLYFDGTTYVFVGSAEGEIKPDSEEVAEYCWFTYEEAINLKFAFGYEQVIQNLFDQNLIK